MGQQPQGSQMSASQSMAQKPALPQHIPSASSYQTMQQAGQNASTSQPLMVPTQTQSTPMQQTPMSNGVDASKMVSQTSMAQGIQFVQKIQQRIVEIQQKLATSINANERQSLQRTLQELTRVQGALMQKLAQGSQMQQAQPKGNVLAQQSPMQPQSGPAAMTGQSIPNQTMPSYGQQTAFPNMQVNPSPGTLPSTATPILQAQPPNAAYQTPAVPSQGIAPNTTLSPDQFKRALTDLMQRHGKPVQFKPIIDGREVDLYRLFTTVQSLGGNNAVMQKGNWAAVAMSLGFISNNPTQLASVGMQIAQLYKTYLELFEEVWNRALVHQLSMANSTGQNKPGMTSKMPMNTGTPVQTNMGSSLNSGLLNPQVNQAQARPNLPITKEQLIQLLQQPNGQQILALLYQKAMAQNNGNPAVAASVPNVPLQMPPQPSTTHLTQPQAQTKLGTEAGTGMTTNVSQPARETAEKRANSIKVTPKMLEDAEATLHKMDMSLSISRPKLPILENLSEEETATVLQQIEKLMPLKTTVAALLPAFLAMTGNIEPAKRVKIMICMFDDQIALLPQKKCILRLSDLEKLKVQMTRCIGFVRLNDDKLAQRIMAKVLSSSTKGQNGKREGSTLERNVFPSDPSSAKRNKPDSPILIRDDEDQISSMSKASNLKNDQISPKSNTSPSAVEQSNKGQNGAHGSPNIPTKSSEHLTDYLAQASSRVNSKSKKNTDLANTSPLEFVEKAWNELLSTEGKSGITNTMDDPLLKSQLERYISQLGTGSISSIIFDMMQMPFSIGESSNVLSKDILGDIQRMDINYFGVLAWPHKNGPREGRETSNEMQENVIDLTEDANNQAQESGEEKTTGVTKITEEQAADWWSDIGAIYT